MTSADNPYRGRRVGRRHFVGAALAAASGAALAGRRLWADVANTMTLPAAIPAVNLSGQAIYLARADIKELRGALRGQLLLTGDEGYDRTRRLWNGAFDRHPALIARCAGQADVVQAVNFARAQELLTAVHSGGHSISGQSSCEGGLMIDLSPMKGIRVAAATQTAVAQSGVLLGEFDQATQAFGLATTLGTAADTGIAGLTLGGGQGRLARKFGLSCDNLLRVAIVTADGRVLRASAQENPDLFWGLRGGGGNFGVVTSFEYRLHPLGPRILAGNRVFPLTQAGSILRGLREFCAGAPDEMSISASLTTDPPGVAAGRYVSFEAVYCGRIDTGERLLAALKGFGQPLFDDIGPKTYLAAQQGASGASPAPLPAGLNVYVKSGFLRSFPDALIDAAVERFASAPPWIIELGFGHLAGAMARVPPAATAYWNRLAQYDLILQGAWSERAHDKENLQAGRNLWDGFEPFTSGYYVNTEPSADEKRLRATYGDNYPRLVSLKDQYDPMNLFRLNANIRPTAHS